MKENLLDFTQATFILDSITYLDIEDGFLNLYSKLPMGG